ncbi:MAG: metallophosphoesterase [Chloroflexota bacterium]|nr:metallophosphoesterase [Chloroflexota bacterium]
MPAPFNQSEEGPGTTLRLLAVSDEVDQRIYSSSLRERMSDIQLVIGCGDVPASYLEFLVDSLNRPVYYVLGNHAEELTRSGDRGVPKLPEGCVDLGGKVIRDPTYGLLMAGLPGSPRYSEREPVQYTEFQMNWMMLKMSPRLIWNRIRYGRYLDLLVTHAPPRDVNDREDIAHRGFRAMRAFLKRFAPAYQVHGHIHLYDRSISNTVRFLDTDVINIYPYQTLDLTFDHVRLPNPMTAVPARGILDDVEQRP